MRGVNLLIIFIYFMKNQSQLETDLTTMKINNEQQEKESSNVKNKKQVHTSTIDATKIKNILEGQSQGQESNESNEQQIQNNNVLQEQLRTNYPFTLKQINHKFKQKHIERQRTYNLYESKLKIKEYLQTMYAYGYDFKYVQWFFKQKQQNDRRYWKEMRRKTYIRMECEKCKENGKKRRWTSILGCVEIRFKVQQLQGFLERFPNFLSRKSIKQELKGMKYQKIVQWELKVYREKCNRCNNWGKTYIYEKQLQAVAMSFCWILAQIMQNNSRPKKTKDDRNKLRQVHKHDESRCEACLKGKCFNIPKQAEGIKTN